MPAKSRSLALLGVRKGSGIKKKPVTRLGKDASFPNRVLFLLGTFPFRIPLLHPEGKKDMIGKAKLAGVSVSAGSIFMGHTPSQKTLYEKQPIGGLSCI